jgi:hypothetical protein
VKRQLVAVTLDSNILGVLWGMPHIFTNSECAKKLYVDGFCDGSDNVAVEK